MWLDPTISILALYFIACLENKIVEIRHMQDSSFAYDIISTVIKTIT